MTISDDEREAAANRAMRRMELIRREQDAERLGGLRAFDTFTKDKFKTTPANGAAFGFATNFDYRRENLFLYGPTGTGKSHLAVIAARKEVQRAASWKPYEISRAVRSAGGAEHEDDVICGIQSSLVLIIDDVGIAKDTEFLVSIIYEIIDWRYMNMPGGLIITSNLSLGDLAQKMGDDRISSRLAQMCKIVSVAGDDYRVRTDPGEARK